MEKTPDQLYSQIQSRVLQDITRTTQQRQKNQQYTVTPIAAHTHDGVDSLPVNYVDLGGVTTYLTSNTVSLSSAQVKLLFTTPRVIVPAPPKRSVNIVEGVTARLVFGTTAYTGTHNLEFHYTNGAGTQVTDSIPAAFINSATSAFYYAPAVSASFAPIEGGSSSNGQVVAFVNTANPATGNSTMILTVHYRVVSFSS